jgi:hypothetical protein
MKNMGRKGDHPIVLEEEVDNFSVVESPIDLSVQKEYQDLSDSMSIDHVNYEEVLAEADRLFVRDTPVEAKKRILILLAHLGTIESSKILQRYLKVSEGTLNDWAILSLKECRMFLESVLLKEEGGFVSTGLGGKGNKLRYYFIVSTSEGRTLMRSERVTLEEGFKGSSNEYESEIEEIDFGTDYAMIGILVPMEIAVGEVIEEGIRRCNRMGEILTVDYYVTNVKKPTKREISKYLRDIRQEGKER